ncbi:MAG TPA: class I SAM-dependent methyltransferase [Kofleriaceae bacterium]
MVTQPTPKHEFLHALHELLQPKTYLEIGVQSGTGMVQALPSTQSIGVDPEPWGSAYLRVADHSPTAVIYPVTSDEFFANVVPSQCTPIELAFIDGMHLIENVLRDFINVEQRAAPDGVIVIDDVLPYSAAITSREPLPGDWTGDVWKLWPILRKWRPELHITMVDVDPTGLMVVQALNLAGAIELATKLDKIIATWAPVDLGRDIADPEVFTARKHAVSPAMALVEITKHRLEGTTSCAL